ncbi:DMT family transporter [Rhodobacteraceae bacterium MCCB 386]|nr:DMT family transporter [Roseitranquillus sediminis]
MRLVLLTCLTMIAFAANSVLNRLALADEAIDPIWFAAIRVAAGALMLAVLAGRGGVGWLRAARPTAAGALTLYMLGFSLAYLALDTGTGALILFGGVQVTMFAAAVLSAEAVPARRWVGTLVALAGLVVLVGRVDLPANEAWAALSMAAAALGWGIYSLIGRTARDPLGATAANFVLSTPLLALALVIAALGGGLGGVTPRGAVLAMVSGAVTSGLGYALWYRVLPSLPRTTAALAQLSVPLIAALGGAVLLGEAVTPRLAVAAALIAAGVTIGTVSLGGRQRTSNSSAS